MVKLLSAIIYNNVPYSLGGSRVPEGGTKIGPVLGYLEEDRDYDGLTIYIELLSKSIASGERAYLKRSAKEISNPVMWPSNVS